VTWFQGVVVYVVTWWIVLFAVLPFGIRPIEKGELGHAAGAPANPRLWFKAGVTTAIATVIWIAFYVVASSNLISFREP
jgi:predicted secreted protein